MKFTPSANWDLAAEAAYRKVTWTTSVRKTSSLSDALFTGTWTQIDSFIVDFPDISQIIERSTGQFVTDSIQIKVMNIAWWKANVLNATASEYIEFRRLASIGIGDAMMSTDNFCGFTGFIEKTAVPAVDDDDSFTLTVFICDEIGNRITAEKITTQYVNDDVDGSGTDGLILPNIPGMWVTNANVSSYVLQKGMHQIDYEYNSGTEQARLDGGDWVTLPTSNGTATLVSENGLEKIVVYVKSTSPSQLSNVSTTLTDYVVVQTAGNTLPEQPLYGLGMRYYLKKLFAEIGLTTLYCDTLQFQTSDGNPKFSYFDSPPQNAAKTGKILAVTNNGTDLFIGIGSEVYKRDMGAESAATISSNPYTLITSKSSYTVARMWYNARNDDLWIWFSGTSTNYVRIYHLGSSSYDEVDISNNVNYNSADLIDYNYTGSSYVHGLVYTNSSNADVRIVDRTATDSQIFSAAAMGYAASYGALTQFVFVKTDSAYFHSHDAVGIYYHKIRVDPAGTWTDDGDIINVPDTYGNGYPAMLNPSESLIYYCTTVASNIVVKTHSLSSSSTTTVLTIDQTQYDIHSMISANSKIYFTVGDRFNNFNHGMLYSAASSIATLENDDPGAPLQATNYAITYMNSILYGVDVTRRLWQYSATLNMYIKQPIWNDTTVKEAITNILTAYNLTVKISSHKYAYIYRRGDDSGNLVGTGDAVTLNETNIVKMTEIEKDIPKISWVEISNGSTTFSYDGTNYNSKVFSDAKTFTLSSDLLPDDLIKDIANMFYTFWSNDHTSYKIETNIARAEFEVMDTATIDYTSDRLTVSGDGLITGTTIDEFANMTFEVLI